MDSLSTAYDFTMLDDVIEAREPEFSPVLVSKPRAQLSSIEGFLEGLDAYAAVFELAGH